MPNKICIDLHFMAIRTREIKHIKPHLLIHDVIYKPNLSIAKIE